MSSESGLRRNVSLVEAVSLEVGLIIGAGLFSLTGVATDIAGTAVFISYVIAFGIVALGLLPTAVLGSAYPTTGGNYRYPSRLWSPAVAFLSAWGLAISMLGGGLPLYALSFGQYAADLIDAPVIPVGVVALTFFFLVNLLGIKVAARVQTMMFVSLVLSLGSFIVFGIPAIDPANLQPLFPTGVGSVLTGAAILYFVCLGANFVVDIGGELTEAATTIPRSFAVSIPLVAVLYVLTGFVAVGTVGWQSVAGMTLTVPARAVLSGPIASFFVVGGALFAIATTMNGVFIIAPKYLLALAEDGLFPEVLGRVNTRFGTPHWGLTAIYVISLAALVSPLPLAQLGSLLGFGGIFLVAPVMIAAVKFARTRPARYRRAAFSLPPRTLRGVAVAAVLLNTVLFVLLAVESTGMFAVWAGAMVVGGFYYLVRTRYLRSRGVDFPDRLRDLETLDSERGDSTNGESTTAEGEE
ncbi:MAG: APC family permease [Halobacteriaceae archaeon]